MRACNSDILSACDVCFVMLNIFRCHANIKYKKIKLGINLIKCIFGKDSSLNN